LGVFKENIQENITREKETILIVLLVKTSKNSPEEGHILLLSGQLRISAKLIA
jgi:hypothetical protein